MINFAIGIYMDFFLSGSWKGGQPVALGHLFSSIP